MFHYAVHEKIRCSCKKTITIDHFGDHIFNCGVSGTTIKRHNAIVRSVQQLLSSLSFQVRLEPNDMFPVGNNGKLRPDLAILNPDYINGISDNMGVQPNIIIDVAQACPRSKSFNVDVAYKTKINKYQVACEENRIKCVPLIFETFGKWPPKTIEFLSSLFNYKVDSYGAAKRANYWIKRISCSIQKELARTVIGRKVILTKT